MSRFRAVFPEDQTDINLSPMLDVVVIMLPAGLITPDVPLDP